jgi:hypothetical protein
VPRRTEPMIVAFANSRQYGNNALVAPRGAARRRKLDVVWVGNRSVWAILKGAPALLLGQHPPAAGRARPEDVGSVGRGRWADPLPRGWKPHQAGRRVVIRTLPRGEACTRAGAARIPERLGPSALLVGFPLHNGHCGRAPGARSRPPGGSALAAGAPPAIRRIGLRGADLRSRLVPTPPTVHRIVGGVAGRAPRHLHGRHVPREPGDAAVPEPFTPSAARLRDARAGNRRMRPAGVVAGACAGHGVHRVGRRLDTPACCSGLRRRSLSGAADAVDGRHAAGDCCDGWKPRLAACRGSATSTVATWREPSWESHRRLLPAARLRHADHDLRGRGQ